MRPSLVITSLVACSGALVSCGGDDEAVGFCELLQRSDQITLTVVSGDTAATASALANGRTVFAQLAAAAPDVMATDVAAVRHGFDEYASALESVGFDPVKLESDPAALARSEVISSDDVTRATANLAMYADTECGITLGR